MEHRGRPSMTGSGSVRATDLLQLGHSKLSPGCAGAVQGVGQTR